MIKTRIARAIACAALAVVPLLAATPAHAVDMTLTDAITALPIADEDRTGYQRSSFKHWTDEDKDSCHTRSEVLIEESRTAPVVEASCKVTGGTWFSYYDGLTLTAPGGLDIDHMVPLAEAWDSGAKAWAPDRREAYANDLGAADSLVAVTAKTNRSKSDQDPAEWMPPSADARCTYISDWVSTKLRWQLSIDPAEREALTRISAGCGQQTVEYTPAP